ncbi:hypothetical protein E2C06_18350 [Dankookia rubra]|uniref:Uncharacterized protein n=1 Tax=Dankookia rubra TaxID=1442381 RepID=A0A4R5QET3_9PROT|nr:hypothetical protein [Dankookia rubra]TDH61198.1 hypothetical protein E2C06_18350 [Dankookia rubra]
MNRISHLTLNTGHLARTSRLDVAQGVIDQLLPLIDAEEGPVPCMPGWYLDFMFPRDSQGARLDGSGFFHIASEPGLSKLPAVLCVACWRVERQAEAWAHVLLDWQALHLALSGLGLWRPAPSMPPALPWLAVWMTPAALMAGIENMMAFGDLERCVAWAIIPDA